MKTNTNLVFSKFIAFFALSFMLLGLFVLLTSCGVLPNCTACSSPPLTNIDGRWELLRWNLPPSQTNGEVRLRKVPHGDNGEPITIKFEQISQRVSGYSGCNNFTASATDDPKGIIIGPVASTRKMCVNAYQMELEQDFLNQLRDYKNIKVNQNELLILGRMGDVLVFGRRSAP